MSSRFLIFLFVVIPFLGFSQQDSLRKKKSFVIYPAFGYQPETSFQLGAIAVWFLKSKDESQAEFTRQSTLTPFFLYTFKKQVLSEVNMDYFFRTGISLHASARYFNFPDSFFGIGNNTDPDVFESYTNRYWQLEGRVFAPLNYKTFVGITFNLQHNVLEDFEPEGVLDAGNLNGTEGGTIFGIGPVFKYDTRDHTNYPSKGYLISAQIRPTIFSDYSYTNFWFDFRKYLKIKNEKNILAFNLNLNFVEGGSIPFYKLPQLGGESRLRGISNASLYRDKKSFFAQVEYRRYLFWKLGIVAFLGIGDVAHSFEEFDATEFKYVVGTGLRYAVLKDEKLNFRFDFGIAKEGQSAFYISMREAF